MAEKHDIVLVNITGVDKPGLMAMVASTLAGYQAAVLDLGQAIIHDTLALGLLVRVADAAAIPALEADLGALLRAEGVPATFQTISHQRYSDWVAAQGKTRYVLTLLARGVYAEQLAVIATIMRDHGLNIETVRRLTGRLPVGRLDSPDQQTSIEFILRGTPTSEVALKSALLEASAAAQFDFSLQRDSVYRRNRRLVAFDMDSTLIDAEVIDELARLHGKGAEVAAITERAMRGELDFKASFRARAALLAGLPERALAEVARTVELNEGADRLLRALQRFGYRTAVLSGGFQYVGDVLRERLGLDYVFANRLVIENGVMTGAVDGEIVDAERKASLLRELAVREGITLEQTIAIGDGANDLLMLDAAGLGIAFHAKPLVRASASHAISDFGLDALLYLLGFSDADIEEALAPLDDQVESG
ncbi:MAG: phosphoserine phosphatase SerB [Pseudomonadota bacterium]